MAHQPAAQDLTAATGITQLSGRPVQDVADATLQAGASLIAEWEHLRPLVTTLRTRLAAELATTTLDVQDAAKLLSTCATVVQKVGAASTGTLRASDGLSRLALLLDAGRVRKASPQQLTEKQLAAVVLETATKIVRQTGKCPICTPIAITEGRPDAG